MIDAYREQLTSWLRRARPELGTTHRLEFKPCFGTVAGYVNGRIFVACGKFGVGLKLPREDLDELFREDDVEHLRYFPNGHTKKDYAVLPRRTLENKRRSRDLVDKSVRFVCTQGRPRSLADRGDQPMMERGEPLVAGHEPVHKL